MPHLTAPFHMGLATADRAVSVAVMPAYLRACLSYDPGIRAAQYFSGGSGVFESPLRALTQFAYGLFILRNIDYEMGFFTVDAQKDRG